MAAPRTIPAWSGVSLCPRKPARNCAPRAAEAPAIRSPTPCTAERAPRAASCPRDRTSLSAAREVSAMPRPTARPPCAARPMPRPTPPMPRPMRLTRLANFSRSSALAVLLRAAASEANMSRNFFLLSTLASDTTPAGGLMSFLGMRWKMEPTRGPKPLATGRRFAVFVPGKARSAARPIALWTGGIRAVRAPTSSGTSCLCSFFSTAAAPRPMAPRSPGRPFIFASPLAA